MFKSFFVVFVSAAVYREIITIGVDYTDFERLRREKKGKMYVSHHHHHLRRPTTERRSIKKNFRGGIYNKLNFMKQNYTEREEERLREKNLN